MPIGATLGAAAIGAGGSILAGKSQSKAAKNAANLTSADNAANRSFLEGIYNRNAGFISPWQTSGVTANNAIMELLGLSGPQAAAQPSAFANYAQPQGGAFNGGDGNYLGDPGMAINGQGGPMGGYGTPAPGGVTTTVPNARSAFDTYRGSTGYDFRVNEGVRALQSAFSRNLESGAASKAALRFGQGIASDEFARYMQMLNQQSQYGLSGASALAGVGQNFGNTVVAGNQAAATAQANARLYAGNANAQMWNGLGSSFGSALGGLKW